MQIYIRVKTAGKRADILSPTPYYLPDSIHSLRQLLTAVVESEVERYNCKEAGLQLIPHLTPEQIDAQARTGKVSFARIFSGRKANPEEAIQNAIQCWQDGLIRVFMGETELQELDGNLAVEEGAVLTFLRFTFLAGRIW